MGLGRIEGLCDRQLGYSRSGRWPASLRPWRRPWPLPRRSDGRALLQILQAVLLVAAADVFDDIADADEVDGLHLEAGVWFGEMGLSLLIVVLIICTQLEVGPR